MKKLVVAGAVLAGLVMTAPVALAQESPLSIVVNTDVCGSAVITFFNGSALGAYTFDYRIDGEAGKSDEFSNLVVKEGPLAGRTFGPVFHPEVVPAKQSKRIVLKFDEDQSGGTVELAVMATRGPEQRELLAPRSVSIDTDCTDEPEPTPTPTPTPTPPPTPTPAPTTPPFVDLDCFGLTDEQAQKVLDADPSDPHNLDADNDGLACDENDFNEVVVPRGGVATGGGPA